MLERSLSALDLIADPVVVFDVTDGRIIHVNPPATDFFKLPFQKVVGQTVYEIFTIVTDKDLQEVFSELTTGEAESVSFEAQYTVPNKARTLTLWMTIKASTLDGRMCAVATCSDITPQRDFSIDSVDIAAKLRAVIEFSRDAIFMIRDDVVLDCNDVALEMFGFDSKEEMFGSWGIRSVPSPDGANDDPRTLRDEHRKKATIEGSASHETTRKRKDGTIFPVEIYYIRPEPEDPTFLLGIVRDISEQVHRDEENRLFRAALDAAGDAHFIIDQETFKVIDVNEAACERLGYSREELIGMTPYDFSDGLEGIDESILENIEGYKVLNRVHIRKDGTKFPVELTTKKVKIQNKNRIVTVARDITERLKREEEYKLFRAAIDMAGDAHYIVDEESYTIIDVNATACKMLGYTREEFIGKSPKFFTEGLEIAEGDIIESSEGYIVFERVHICKDGSKIPVEISIRTVKIADRGIIIAEARDISKRKERDDEVKRFRAAMDGAGDSIFIVDAEKHVIIDANKTAYEELGYSSDELLGNSPKIINPEFGIDKIKEIHEKAKGTKEAPIVLETVHKRKDGSTFPVEISLSPLVNNEMSILVVSARNITKRKEDEREMKLFQVALDSAGDLLAMIDAENDKILRFNERAMHFLGYSSKELNEGGPSLIDINLGPDDVQELYEVVKSSPDNQYTMQTRMRKKNGELFDAEVMLTVLPSENSKFLIASARDVSKRVEAEMNNVRFRAAMDSTMDGIFLFEGHGKHFVDVNKTACTMLGYSRTELLTMGPQDIDPSMDEEKTMNIHDRLMQSGSLSEVVETFLNTKEGKSIPVEIILTPLTGTGDPIVLATVRDISQRKESEIALMRSEAKLTTMSEVAPIGIAVQGADGLFTYANKTILDNVGMESKEQMGETNLWRERLHPDEHDEIVGALKNWAGSTPLFRKEFRYLHPERGEIYHLMMIAPIYTDSEISDYAVVLIDITEQRRAAAQLEDARDDAEQANAAKSEFLSRMSHELRTPLNAILGFAQVLEDRELNDVDAECLKHILDGGEHLLGLINEVLDISRIDTGTSDLYLEPTSVEYTVTQAVGLMRKIAEGNEVLVETKAPDNDAIAVFVDRKRMHQVLINVISNAIKYNKPGGLVTISWRKEGDNCLIEVVDTGVGISEDGLERILVPFDRLGAESSKVEGIGLGLCLSAKFVTAMNGEIKFASKIDKGTTVSLTIPLTTDGESDSEKSEVTGHAEREVMTSAKTILLVEDNVSNIQLMRTIFSSKTQWKLTVCKTTEEIFNSLPVDNPDLVLLDINLPEMDGVEVLSRIRLDPKTAKLPVVMLSANADQQVIEQFTNLGADKFLTKPIDVVELINTIGSLLERES